MLSLLLTAALIVVGVAGRPVVGAAAPVLVRVPRVAVTVLAGGVLLWSLAVSASLLMVAGSLTGPGVLPGAAGEICRRCLAEAGPFGSSLAVASPLPFAFVAGSVLLVVASAVGGAIRGVVRLRRTATAAGYTVAGAREGELDGHRVHIIDAAQPVAFSLPRRRGGIVVSTGFIAGLGRTERAAVLAHEEAHLKQGHHGILALVDGLTWPLRWAPMVRAVADAIPHYLEIAADDAARRQVGTAALASALLRLGTPAVESQAPAVLHAAGPHRVQHLVNPRSTGSAWLPAAALGMAIVSLGVVVAMIHGAYVGAAFNGCHVL